MNFENILGSGFADNLVGNAKVNVLRGGDGGDKLTGLGGADTLVGGIGHDAANYIASALAVTVTLGKDGSQTVGVGGDAAGDKISEIEWVIGSKKNDVLTGNNLGNTLDGDEGDDLIQGGASGDLLLGGDGFDTLSYANSSAGITVNFTADTAFGGDAEGDDYAGFERLIGSSFHDEMHGKGGMSTPGRNRQ